MVRCLDQPFHLSAIEPVDGPPPLLGSSEVQFPTREFDDMLGLFDDTAAQLVATSVREAAHMREDLRDIISYAVERLSQRRYELPGFSTIQREARTGRAEVNGQLCHTVYTALGAVGRAHLDQMWSEPGRETNTTLWNDVKRDPGPPTLKEVRAFLHHARWLAGLKPAFVLASVLPDAKLRQFAAEASTLDAGSMKRLSPARRYTLGAALSDSCSCVLAARTARAARRWTNVRACFTPRLGSPARSRRVWSW